MRNRHAERTAFDISRPTPPNASFRMDPTAPNHQTKDVEMQSASSNTPLAVGPSDPPHGSGRSVAWLARLNGVQKVAGSSPAASTILTQRVPHPTHRAPRKLNRKRRNTAERGGIPGLQNQRDSLEPWKKPQRRCLEQTCTTRLTQTRSLSRTKPPPFEASFWLVSPKRPYSFLLKAPVPQPDN